MSGHVRGREYGERVCRVIDSLEWNNWEVVMESRETFKIWGDHSLFVACGGESWCRATDDRVRRKMAARVSVVEYCPVDCRGRKTWK